MIFPEIRDEGQCVTIITGAGPGLGRALAESLARKSRPLLLVGRREAFLMESRLSCMKAGIPDKKCQILAVDLTAEGSAEHIVSEAIDRFGCISALVNNAGLARFGAIDQADPTDWGNMILTNLLGPAALIKHVAPELRKTKGTIVNVGSIGGLLALPGRALYGASKAALAHLTRSLARELAPDIRVNAVLPGAIETEMYDNLGLDREAVSGLRADMVLTTPMGRMGTTDDVVPWIEMLLGPAGHWVTGSLLVIDGGRSC